MPGAPSRRAPCDVPFGQGVDHRLLDPVDVLAHADFQALQVQQRVQHDLPRAVVGHLPAAIDVDHGDITRHQHVLILAGLAEREHGIVLDQPQLVAASSPRASVKACIARQTGS